MTTMSFLRHLIKKKKNCEKRYHKIGFFKRKMKNMEKKMEEPVYCCKLYTTQYKSWSLKLMVFGSSKNLIVANSIILVAEARWAWLLTRIGGVGGRRKRSRANSRGVAAAGMHCMRMPHLPSGGRLSKGNQNSKSSTFNSPLFLPQSSPILNC